MQVDMYLAGFVYTVCKEEMLHLGGLDRWLLRLRQQMTSASLGGRNGVGLLYGGCQTQQNTIVRLQQKTRHVRVVETLCIRADICFACIA
jgi:hypothetical protein